jgi:hypothetical protein
MTDTTYNGWTNWATWNVHLWLTNEPGSYEYATETARAGGGRGEMREAVETFYNLPTDGLAADLIGAELDDVDWDEIIAALREE